MTPLFRAAVRATEEAIINALVAAEDIKGIPDPNSGTIRTASAITGMKHPSLTEIIEKCNPYPDPLPYPPEN
jgi:hypothetical protein